MRTLKNIHGREEHLLHTSDAVRLGPFPRDVGSKADTYSALARASPGRILWVTVRR